MTVQHQSRREALRRATRRCLAVAAILGVVAYLGFSVWVVGEREVAIRASATCLKHEKAMAQSMLLYLADYDQTFPPASTWSDSLIPRLSSVDSVTCPGASNQNWSFAFAAPLGRVNADTTADPRLTIMLFESDAGWSAAGGPELLPDRPRHVGGDNYVFVDGRVAWRSRRHFSDAHGGTVWAKREDGYNFSELWRWEPVRRPQPGGRQQR